MKIINHTEHVVTYEIRGGPLGMILSTCDLAPGEEEVWTVPVPLQHVALVCAVRVWSGDDLIDREVGADGVANVIRDARGAIDLTIA